MEFWTFLQCKYNMVRTVCVNLQLCTSLYHLSQLTVVDELKFVLVHIKPAVVYTRTVLTIRCLVCGDFIETPSAMP